MKSERVLPIQVQLTTYERDMLIAEIEILLGPKMNYPALSTLNHYLKKDRETLP